MIYNFKHFITNIAEIPKPLFSSVFEKDATNGQ